MYKEMPCEGGDSCSVTGHMSLPPAVFRITGPVPGGTSAAPSRAWTSIASSSGGREKGEIMVKNELSSGLTGDN